ncbi:unnamed protein product [Symbiodinium natans]|uniref:Uncharacterized protein n=1 Tax=Symbiodinium natans TaxID=878477 RepID=A0A812PJW0_9DINO|nr:unnamed protein product [Symbiodinium natans]
MAAESAGETALADVRHRKPEIPGEGDDVPPLRKYSAFAIARPYLANSWDEAHAATQDSIAFFCTWAVK